MSDPLVPTLRAKWCALTRDAARVSWFRSARRSRAGRRHRACRVRARTGEIDVATGGALTGFTRGVTTELCRIGGAGEVLATDVVRQLGLGSRHRLESIGERTVARQLLTVARLRT